MEDDRKRINQALAYAVKWKDVDGAHHKDWLIDQMVRALAGGRPAHPDPLHGLSETDEYAAIVSAAKNGEDGPDSYVWDTGTPP